MGEGLWGLEDQNATSEMNGSETLIW